MSAAALKTRIFRYIDSLQKLEDTHIDNIQKQLGLVIPPYEETKGAYSQYFDDLTDGGRFSVSVMHPTGEDTTYGVDIFNNESTGKVSAVPCRYTYQAFREMLLTRGFEDGVWVGPKLRAAFRKRFGDIGLSVALWTYTHEKPDGGKESCVAQVSISMGVRVE
ncbi:hypothetical protein EBB59_13295 [Lysobacter pythonis]|uniref:Uncharacterized protein n=1 Tax=Solilutibacter pythonis TaxID=2483112 RepID=A0A3M2HJZ4_9GAMM|nr:hypothetical protein EBB59_13295 [Lysobacter pythonis]